MHPRVARRDLELSASKVRYVELVLRHQHALRPQDPDDLGISHAGLNAVEIVQCDAIGSRRRRYADRGVEILDGSTGVERPEAQRGDDDQEARGDDERPGRSGAPRTGGTIRGNSGRGRCCSTLQERRQGWIFAARSRRSGLYAHGELELRATVRAATRLSYGRRRDH